MELKSLRYSIPTGDLVSFPILPHTFPSGCQTLFYQLFFLTKVGHRPWGLRSASGLERKLISPCIHPAGGTCVDVGEWRRHGPSQGGFCSPIHGCAQLSHVWGKSILAKSRVDIGPFGPPGKVKVTHCFGPCFPKTGARPG